ncbi:MAG TPA: hypothetical protein VKZ43_06270, partial [Trueperaceae bacterium]|nr:hypothetical protein [Trueperaceae bacterium]
GLREKYGMEFRAPRLREAPEPQLVARHRREIAPLLRDRAAFASSERFRLFTLRGEDGSARQDVIVYGFAASEGGASLIAFNNSPRHTAGVIDRCEPFADTAAGEGAGTVDLALLPALGLGDSPGEVLVARLHPDGHPVDWHMEELTSAGLALALGPYEYRVYRGIHVAARVVDDELPVATVNEAARGRKVPRSSLLAGRRGVGVLRAAARRRRG